jgi:hypothetical protein
MLVVLRIAGIVVVFVILVCVLLFFLTRDRKYLRIAYRVFQYAAMAALALLAYLALERATEMLLGSS